MNENKAEKSETKQENGILEIQEDSITQAINELIEKINTAQFNDLLKIEEEIKDSGYLLDSDIAKKLYLPLVRKAAEFTTHDLTLIIQFANNASKCEALDVEICNIMIESAGKAKVSECVLFYYTLTQNRKITDDETCILTIKALHKCNRLRTAWEIFYNDISKRPNALQISDTLNQYFSIFPETRWGNQIATDKPSASQSSTSSISTSLQEQKLSLAPLQVTIGPSGVYLVPLNPLAAPALPPPPVRPGFHPAGGPHPYQQEQRSTQPGYGRFHGQPPHPQYPPFTQDQTGRNGQTHQPGRNRRI